MQTESTMQQDQEFINTRRKKHTFHFDWCRLSAIGLEYVPVVTQFGMSSLKTKYSKPIQFTWRWRVLQKQAANQAANLAANLG